MKTSPRVFRGVSHKNEHVTNQGNENASSGGKNINIGGQRFSGVAEGISSNSSGKHKDKKTALEKKLHSKNDTANLDKENITKACTSRSKTSTLEVEWTHLKTPPRDRKTNYHSPPQIVRSAKKPQTVVDSHSSVLQKSSPNRRIAQKARTTNLALSMKAAQSANISTTDEKPEKRIEANACRVDTKRRGRCDNHFRITNPWCMSEKK